jgi:DNA invertase Pin-like site-specific DNA recombinase
MGLSPFWNPTVKPRAYSYLRMSTDVQLKGDSRRRQLEASLAYAAEHGLELADDAQLEDIGVSAFRGANVREGALGRFLDAAERGGVPRGSYLLVESLDRLSREQVRSALALFLRIGQAGIIIVTLIDGRVHRPEDNDVTGIIISIIALSTAREESEKKSYRGTQTWKNKRALAALGKPMTARCPGWLRLSADRERYEVIAERAEIVRQVFSDYDAGLGMYTIAQRLNEAGTSAFEGKKGWHQSSINKMLANRAAIGEFQAHTCRDKLRIVEGDVIENYYPAIVDPALFYRVQDARRERATREGSRAGRKGSAYSNLFTKLARCAYCQSPIVFENKGQGTKGGTYLVCDGAKRRRGCNATRWRYKDFEASFLAFVTELNIEAMINEDDEARRRRDLEASIASIKGELSSVEGEMERAYRLHETGAATEFVSRKLQELEERRKALLGSASASQQTLDSLNSRISIFYESKEDIRAFVERLQNPEATELFKLRAQIAARLKTLIVSLKIAPLGDRRKTEKIIEFLREQPDSTDVISYMENRLAGGEADAPYFSAEFRNGSVRAVYPERDDPLDYFQLIQDDGSGRAHISKPSQPEEAAWFNWVAEAGASIKPNAP